MQDLFGYGRGGHSARDAGAVAVLASQEVILSVDREGEGGRVSNYGQKVNILGI